MLLPNNSEVCLTKLIKQAHMHARNRPHHLQQKSDMQHKFPQKTSLCISLEHLGAQNIDEILNFHIIVQPTI